MSYSLEKKLFVKINIFLIILTNLLYVNQPKSVETERLAFIFGLNQCGIENLKTLLEDPMIDSLTIWFL